MLNKKPPFYSAKDVLGVKKNIKRKMGNSFMYNQLGKIDKKNKPKKKLKNKDLRFKS